MPTYDYECTSCGHTFEYFQAMSDDPLTECPKCGGKVKRLIGGGLGVIFKGSGFYVTDNRSGKNASASGSGSGNGKGNGAGNGNGASQNSVTQTNEKKQSSPSHKDKVQTKEK